MLLIAMPNHSLAHVVSNELISIFHCIDEFIARNKRELTGYKTDQQNSDEPTNDHPEDILRHTE